jgi:hypothetical protein
MRPPIVLRTSKKRSPVTEDQVSLFCRLSDDLVRAFHDDSSKLRYKPEYERFVQGAYACGFVCSDIVPVGSVLKHAEKDGWVEKAPFLTVRRYVHTLIRSERHADMGEDWGGGNIYSAIRSGVLQRIVSRLASAREWRKE